MGSRDFFVLIYVYYDTSALSGPLLHDVKFVRPSAARVIIHIIQWATEGTSIVRYFIARLHKSAVTLIRGISSPLQHCAIAPERKRGR